MIEHTTPADGNVFADIGFPPEEAETKRVCSRLMIAIEDLIDQRGLKRAAAAKLFGVSPARLRDMERGRMSAFTVDSLVEMLARAGFRVDVSVRAIPAQERAAAQALDAPQPGDIEEHAAA